MFHGSRRAKKIANTQNVIKRIGIIEDTKESLEYTNLSGYIVLNAFENLPCYIVTHFKI